MLTVFGAGGHAAEVFGELPNRAAVQFVVDTEEQRKTAQERYEFELIALSSELERARALEGFIAVGEPRLKQQLHFRWSAAVALWPAIVSKGASMAGCDLGETGLYLGFGAYLSEFTRIGKFVHINRGAMVSHDCEVGDYCHIAPGAHLLGGAKIGHGTVIGAGAVVLPMVSVGNRCVVGAGSVVTNDIPDGFVAYGAPARLVRENS